MTYTFYHAGVLIGESDLDQPSHKPRQIGGEFRPTAYGLEIFPRLTGILSASHALKSYLDDEGLDPDNMTAGAVEELLQTTAAGMKIIDIGRALSEVELRAPGGRKLEFESIAFTDLHDLQRLARELDDSPDDEPMALSSDAPRYIVSTTLRAGWSVPADRKSKRRRR